MNWEWGTQTASSCPLLHSQGAVFSRHWCVTVHTKHCQSGWLPQAPGYRAFPGHSWFTDWLVDHPHGWPQSPREHFPELEAKASAYFCLFVCLFLDCSILSPPPTHTVLSLSHRIGTSLAVQGLRPHAFKVGDMGSIPGQETKIPQAMWHNQKKNNSHIVWG